MVDLARWLCVFKRSPKMDPVCVLSHSAVSGSLRPHGLQPARLLCPWDSPGKNTGVGYHFLLQGLPDQRIESTSPALQVDSVSTEPAGKPNPESIYLCVSWLIDAVNIKFPSTSNSVSSYVSFGINHMCAKVLYISMSVHHSINYMYKEPIERATFYLCWSEVNIHGGGYIKGPTLGDSVDCSPPGSSVHGILQARILE